MRGLPGLKEQRRAKNISQRELAERVGLSVISICRYECGASNASAKAIAKIAKCLDVPEYLLIYPELVNLNGIH